MRLNSLLPLGVLAAAPAAPAPPYWGPTWTAPHNQSVTIVGQQTWTWTTQWYYDSTTKPYGSSLYEYTAGQHDELCTMVVGHENDEARCSLLATSDGGRYVLRPDTRSCCKACDVSEYCGIVRPDWLQTNATYQGSRVFPTGGGAGSVTCYGWMKEGKEQNFWWATGEGIPCLYYEGYPTLAAGNNTWFFDPAEVVREVPQGVFELPTGWDCSGTCTLGKGR